MQEPYLTPQSCKLFHSAGTSGSGSQKLLNLMALFALDEEETPLSQTNFLPDLMHVYVLLDATEVIPALLQALPALAAAFTGIRGIVIERESIDKKVTSFLFTYKA